jgi:hypothetical protein
LEDSGIRRRLDKGSCPAGNVKRAVGQSGDKLKEIKFVTTKMNMKN